MFLFNWLAVLAIGLYQETISPHLQRRGLRCRFHPSCSQYAVLAFSRYGFIKAAVLTGRRYLDCHPGSKRAMIDFP